MPLSSLFRSLLAAYACGASGSYTRQSPAEALQGRPLANAQRTKVVHLHAH